MNKTKIIVALLTCAVAVSCTQKKRVDPNAAKHQGPEQLGFSAEEMKQIRKDLGGVKDDGTGNCASGVIADFEKQVGEINSVVTEIREYAASVDMEVASSGSSEDRAHLAQVFQDHANSLSGVINKCRSITSDHLLVRCEDASVQRTVENVRNECDNIEGAQEEIIGISSSLAAKQE